MKTFVYLPALVLALPYSCDKEEFISETELPAISREFLQTHFNGISINAIVKETEVLSKDYTVYLANGFEIGFTKKGSWDDVDGKTAAVPQTIQDILPGGIARYVSNTLPACYIVEINKEHYGYEIGLSNDMDLKFNSKGEFIRIDD
ncbi:MAG: PepSY-like domain-containing protein [Tannerellaceae bacterium]|jgi:hypothetical protein|nr:PepSY-like domain-containing protein [Tannerellaceae bacterium]